MNPRVKLEASLACANFAHLEADVRNLEAAGIDYLHIDIMDGRFVPNFCLDFNIMQTVRRFTSLPLECHLMVVEPERYIAQTVAAGAEYVSIHYEAGYHIQRILQEIRKAGAKPAIALCPATPLTALEYILDDFEMLTIMTVNPGFAGQQLIPAMLGKITDARALLDSTGHSHVEIQVDGNVSFEHIPAMVAAGATMLVGGTSSIFHKDYSIQEAVAATRQILKGIGTHL